MCNILVADLYGAINCMYFHDPDADNQQIWNLLGDVLVPILTIS